MFNPIAWALRRPVTVLTLCLGIFLLGMVARSRMRTDIFPNLNLPVIYVCQPYGGMDPSQMEGLLTNYYEYHFLYVNGIHHVESRNVQGLALMKLYFHPGTDMAQAMAETLGYVTRSRAFMPPGTVSPFVTRFDAGSIPVGYLVLSSETRTINEIQDQALFKVRPMFSGLPGVSAPPPFGGSQRTIVVRLDPDRLRSYRMAPDEVIQALNTGNAISPSGTVRFGDSMPIVPVNALARDVEEFKQIPIRPGKLPTVHLGDVASVTDSADVPVGSAIINGRKAVYLLVTKRADASTLDVIENVRNALPDMRAVLPPDIKVALEFDQSPTVTTAVRTVVTEAALGAGLVGMMVLLFLRDWRSMVIVIVNIPLALAGAVTLLWVTGQTFNLMTLGGLALAIGILVDESTVEIENIHTQLEATPNVAVAVRRGNRETAVPRLLALLCMLAVFAPSFLMTGAVRSLFVPLSLAVGFAMISSYLLSSTLVPVLAAMLLKPHGPHGHAVDSHSPETAPARPVRRFSRPVQACFVLAYVVACGFGIARLAPSAGFEIFPKVDSGRFQVRVKAPAGTRFEKTERIVVDVLDAIKGIVGEEGVEVSVGYVGNIASSYPIQAIFQWTGGPEEAFLRVALNPERARLSVDETKEKLRAELARIHPDVKFSLEPADIVSEVMSFGSPTPVDVVVSGSAYADVRTYAAKIHEQLALMDNLRDLRYGQTLDYPALRVNIDRRLAGLAGISAADVARSLVTATSSSRFILPSYWPDPKSGIGYQVQVEIPYVSVVKAEDLENLPVNAGQGASPLVLRDVATVRQDTVTGEFDRYDMKRLISLTANVTGDDLAVVARDVKAAIRDAGDPPAGVKVNIRGQLATLDEINAAGVSALAFTFVVILLMLTAYFQSVGLALVSLASVPAVGLGITLTLLLTGTTWNLQSYMGSIMALGVSVANAILLVSFAEARRRAGSEAADAAHHALKRRVRPILMTALAMIAGMFPMALGWSEGGRQQAPLGRAVIGGLLGSLVAVMIVTPRAFALARKNASRKNPSLDPTDPESSFYAPDADSPATPEVPVIRPVMTSVVALALCCGITSKAEAQQPNSPRVNVVEAVPARIVHTIDQPGQVEPQAKAPLESRVQGWVQAVHFDIGETVKAGQVLIEVAAPELEAAVTVAQALVDQAKSETELAHAQLKETEGSLSAQEARLKATEAELGGRKAVLEQMKLERDRMRKLVENGAVTRVVLDEAEQRMLTAEAELLQARALIAASQADADTARSQLLRRRAEIEVAKARTEVASARLIQAKAQLGLTRITAPFDGVIVERNVDPGKLVGESPRDKPLILIHDESVLTVSVGIPEAEAPLVNIGDETLVFTGQETAAPAYRGKITRISRGYDPTSRTMRCEIDVPAASTSLRSGQYVLVRIIGHDQDDAVTVPANAVFRVAGVPHVCVIVDSRVQRRKVVPGVGDGTRVAISSGLAAGERVVAGPVAATLVDGQTVEAVSPAPPKP